MKRDIMSEWYSQVVQFLQQYNIKECYQVVNADETMIDTTLANKYTWTSGKSYVKVNGLKSPVVIVELILFTVYFPGKGDHITMLPFITGDALVLLVILRKGSEVRSVFIIFYFYLMIVNIDRNRL
jgi:hypothetical protein